MIIEGILTWLMQVFQWAISILPSNGTMFGNIPSLSFTSLKYISLLNGYLPIKELGAMFLLFITIYTIYFQIVLLFWVLKNIRK